MKALSAAIICAAAIAFAGNAQKPAAANCAPALDTPTAVTGKVPAQHRFNAPSTNTWQRGCGKGVRVYLPTDTWDTGARRMVAWRLCEFDADGRLMRIAPQSIITDSISVEQLR